MFRFLVKFWASEIDDLIWIMWYDENCLQSQRLVKLTMCEIWYGCKIFSLCACNIAWNVRYFVAWWDWPSLIAYVFWQILYGFSIHQCPCYSINDVFVQIFFWWFLYPRNAQRYFSCRVCVLCAIISLLTYHLPITLLLYHLSAVSLLHDLSVISCHLLVHYIVMSFVH